MIPDIYYTDSDGNYYNVDTYNIIDLLFLRKCLSLTSLSINFLSTTITWTRPHIIVSKLLRTIVETSNNYHGGMLNIIVKTRL